MSAPNPIVSVEWLIAHRDDANLKILDTRPRDQYLRGHIPGAILVEIAPAKLLSSAEPAVERWHTAVESFFRHAGISTGDTIVTYEDFSGTSAAYGMWLGDVANLAGSAMLDGGFNAWLGSGQPVEQQPNTPTPSNFTLRANQQVIATAQTIVSAITQAPDSLQIVDSRADQEFFGATIPGSKHLDWMQQLNPDGTFRPMDDLRAAYIAQGIDLDADTPIATFCGSGMRAANAYVVLKQLGAKQPQNYGPSWTEWGNQPQLPKQRPDFPDD
jgi:thiosulfate/3-mercaptopyruvate sulfurtransferase